MSGYYGKPDATAAAFHGDWFRTGDLARRDAEDRYYILGRIKDMIKRSGENVAPDEVESVLEALPGVAEAAVVGVPDERRARKSRPSSCSRTATPRPTCRRKPCSSIAAAISPRSSTPATSSTVRSLTPHRERQGGEGAPARKLLPLKDAVRRKWLYENAVRFLRL